MAETEKTQKRRIRIRNLLIRGIMLAVFALIVLQVIENLVIPLLKNEYISVENGEQVLSNVGLGFLIAEESDIPMDLQVIQSIRGEYGGAAVKVYLRNAALSGMDLSASVEQVCLTKLWVVDSLPIPEDSAILNNNIGLANLLNELASKRELSKTFDDYCVARDKIKVKPFEEETSLLGVIPYTSGLSPYYYPFDTRTIDLEIWAETEIEYEDGTREVRMAAPNVLAQYNLPNWQLDLYKEQAMGEDETHLITRFQLSLSRSFASRLLTITMLLSLFVIIILLSFTHRMDAFIQASVAVLLTLLGIQDLLVPTSITEATIVSQAILSLYILFAMAILIRLTIIPIWEHTRGSEPNEPDDDEEA